MEGDYRNGTGRHLHNRCRDAWRVALQPIVAYPAGRVSVLVIHCDRTCRCSASGAENGTVSLRCNIANFRFTHSLQSRLTTGGDIAQFESTLQSSCPAASGISSNFRAGRCLPNPDAFFLGIYVIHSGWFELPRESQPFTSVSSPRFPNAALGAIFEVLISEVWHLTRHPHAILSRGSFLPALDTDGLEVAYHRRYG